MTVESHKVILVPALWLTCYDLLVDGRACGPASLPYLSMSPLIFVGGLATARVYLLLDGYDFVRLPAQWIGTTLRDSTRLLQISEGENSSLQASLKVTKCAHG